MTDSTDTLAQLVATLDRVEAAVLDLTARRGQGHDCGAEALAARVSELEAREAAQRRRWWVPVACSLLAGTVGGVVGYLLGAG